MASIGGTIDEMFKIRAQIRALEDQAKQLEQEYEAKESALFSQMDNEGTRIASGKFAKVHIDEEVYPNVENWDEVYKYIGDNKYYHLLQRRFSASGFRELNERGTAVPGVVPFKKRKIKLIQT